MLLITGLAIVLPASTRDKAVSYADDVAPIFERSCVRCHGGLDEGELRIEAGLDLTSYEKLVLGSEFGEVLTPGEPDRSIIVDLIEVGDMPSEGDPLDPEEIELIRTWVAEGAVNN